MKTSTFLPVNRTEMLSIGIKEPDFVLVTGDAYVDHPSFGAAIIGRLLESEGFSVCILSQPDYNDLNSFSEFGEPRYGFLVTSGNIDSMVNHYTAARKKRSKDSYSPGGQAGKRPDRAAIVYSQKIRAAYKNKPIILGGLEASLRRLAHYDYWDDKLRRSILFDSGADIIVYGMGERAIIEIAKRLEAGENPAELTDINGTVYKYKSIEHLEGSDFITLPDYGQIRSDKRLFAKSFITQYENTGAKTAKKLVEGYDEGFAIQNPPAEPLSQTEIDKIYSLPYTREYHPMYSAAGGVPAIEEIKFSLTSVRGCFGACNFCALCFHQGRTVQPRSHKSIIEEALKLTEAPDFKGYIHDVGGPTANFRAPACGKQAKNGACMGKKCLFPKPCESLKVSHRDYMTLLDKLRELPKVKKVFVRSGIRYDYVMADKDKTFLYKLCKNHISGQLKVAPEHVSAEVLQKMGKPSKEVFDKFSKAFYNINLELGLKQYLVPYLMSGHPGSTLKSAVELAEYLKNWGYTPEQVQDFYPTPATVSTCMYYTGLDPFTMEPVYVAKDPREKAMQRALIQYRLPQNYALVYEALKKTGRLDLVGYGSKCLIRPQAGERQTRKPLRSEESDKKQKSVKKKTIRNIHKKKGF